MMIALLLTASQPTPAVRDINRLCRSQPACVAVQRAALRHFLGHLVMYRVPDAAAERCMRAGKRSGLIDWTVAERCIRAWSKGRRSVVAQGVGER